MRFNFKRLKWGTGKAACHEGAWGAEVSLHAFLTSTLDGSELQSLVQQIDL
jgi:hypothetical protein